MMREVRIRIGRGLLMLSALAALVAGCGDDDSKKDETPADSTSAEQPIPTGFKNTATGSSELQQGMTEADDEILTPTAAEFNMTRDKTGTTTALVGKMRSALRQDEE